MNEQEKYRYSNEWIFKLERELHWRWYWHQQKLMEGALDKNARIAEIGVGSKFTYNYLAAKGFNIKSIDIDKEKKPDILANIVTCSDEILKFDTILAFNIFEHIPYEEFIQTVEKFRRNSVKQLFIGLPMYRKTLLELKMRVGRFFNEQIILTWPKSRITTKNHHWELGYKSYKHMKLVEDFSKLSYSLQKHFSFKSQAYYYFLLDV